jgi:hypothetical protein
MKTIYQDETHKIDIQLKKERGLFQQHQTNSQVPCLIIWRDDGKDKYGYALKGIISL